MMNLARCFLLLIVLVLSAGCPTQSSAQEARRDFDVTNGPVYALTQIGNTLYVGGDFTRSGPPTGGAAGLSANTGKLDGFPGIHGHVLTVAPDGAGGWFIGGSFDSVGGVTRNNIAHLGPDYSVSTWATGTNERVHSILVDGSTVYIGGYFNTVGGLPRNRVAALDATTGIVRPWAVNVDTNGDTYVRTLALNDGALYLGGQFTTVGANNRANVAAVDAISGDVLTWSPNVNGPVVALEVGDSAVFVGGLFTNVLGFARNNLAAVHPITGFPLSWSADADRYVGALTLSGSDLFVGGGFASINGQARSRVAMLNAETAVVSPWAPEVHGNLEGRDGTVRDLLVSGSIVYVAGYFNSVGTESRTGLAAIDRGTGNLTSWDPYAYSGAVALAVHDSIVFAGGDFFSIGGSIRNRLAAINVVGLPTFVWLKTLS